MKTIELKIYSFDELSEEAKEVAIENYRNNNTEVFWASENRDTMEKFAELFPIKVTHWEYGGRGEGVDFHFTADDTIEELSGTRLATYIWNNYRNEIYKPKQYWICQGHHNAVGMNAKHRNSKIFLDRFGCPLTGYCMDDDIIAPLFDFMDKPTNQNFKELLEDCFDEWIKACNTDIEWQNSDEYITEELVNNGYEFEEDGTKY